VITGVGAAKAVMPDLLRQMIDISKSFERIEDIFKPSQLSLNEISWQDLINGSVNLIKLESSFQLKLFSSH
jgi:hypothetical protein